MTNPTLVSILADIITDLTAAALAAVVIVPLSAARPRNQNINLIVLNASLAILGLAVVWILRTL